MDPKRIAAVQPLSQPSKEIQSNCQNPSATEAPGQDPGSSSIEDVNNRQVSGEDIEIIQNLIERCLQLYMNKAEVVRILSNRAKIEPVIIALVWKKLEEENSEFFKAYYIRLKLKKQIILFNQLLKHQYHLMKYPIIIPKVPLVPMQNGIHPVCAVNNLPTGYPVLQPPIPTTGQLHVDPVGCGLSSRHVVNGIPSPGKFHPIHMNTGNDIVMATGTSEAAPSIPQCSKMSSMSEMAGSPVPVASSTHTAFGISMGMGAPANDTTFISDAVSTGELELGADGGVESSRFTSDAVSTGELQLGADGGVESSKFISDVVSTGELQLGTDGGISFSREPTRSLGHLWNFSLSDLTTDLTNLGDLGDLGDYVGSPFLLSDSDIFFDPPDPDDIVEEYFADLITGPCSQSDENKSYDRTEAFN